MPISHELIFEAKDLSAISIVCRSCGARVSVSPRPASLKNPPPPPACPACGLDWQEAQLSVVEFRKALKGIDSFRVLLHIPRATTDSTSD
jgi:hypothetical protein